MRCIHCYKKGVSILPLWDTPKGIYGQCNNCSYVVPKYIPDSLGVLFIIKIVKWITKDYRKVISVLKILRLYHNENVPK